MVSDKDTDLWATAREWAERSGTVTSDLARLALAEHENAEYRRAVVDALKAKHEGGSGAFWAEWHRDHCAAARAADAARADLQSTVRALTEALADKEEQRDAARAEVADLREWKASALTDIAWDECPLGVHGRYQRTPARSCPWCVAEDAEQALSAARVEVADLRSALEHTETNLRAAVNRKPVRDMTENLAENDAALGDADTLAEAKARAKAEALREFADECDGPDSSLHIMGAAQAARERADRIEGATDER